MAQAVVSVLIGLFCGLLGAALKSWLTCRFFLNGGTTSAGACMFVRVLIDVIWLYGTHFWSGALVACALGLTADQLYFLWKSRVRKR